MRIIASLHSHIGMHPGMLSLSIFRVGLRGFGVVFRRDGLDFSELVSTEARIGDPTITLLVLGGRHVSF